MARILIVEDDEDIRSLVMRRLARAGHVVEGAGGATEALALLAGPVSPDLVVLDVNMPGGIDGFDLLRTMRDQAGLTGLPAIFLSGSIQPDDLAAGRSLGAAYLAKPFGGAALLAAIGALLAGRAAPTVEPATDTW
jgi:DNA-binding response OmpR family regulator